MMLTWYNTATRSSPGVFLYSEAQLRNISEHFFFTSGSERFEVPQTRTRSSRGSSLKVRWKRGPAFWIRPSSSTRALSCLWTLPYLSFFLRALAASAGPDPCNLMTSTRSGIPLRSSSSYCSLVRRSTVTVTAEYGFFYSNVNVMFRLQLSHMRDGIGL